MKDIQATEEAFGSQKREHQAFQNMIYYIFIFLRVIFALLDTVQVGTYFIVLYVHACSPYLNGILADIMPVFEFFLFNIKKNPSMLTVVWGLSQKNLNRFWQNFRHEYLVLRETYQFVPISNPSFLIGQYLQY